MITRPKLPQWTPAFISLAFSVAACSPQVAKTPMQPQNLVSDGVASSGVITATRPVTISADQTSIQEGVNGVLAALHEPPTVQALVNATEFVVQRSDGTSVSMVTRLSNGDPDSAMTSDGFSVGQRVEIIDGAQGELIHRN